MSANAKDRWNLLKRVVTGFFGILLIVGLMTYGGRWGVTLLALVGCFGALYEYFSMLFQESEKRLQQFVGIGVGIGLSTIIIFRAGFLYEGISLVFIGLFLFYLALSYSHAGNHESLFSDLSHTLIGIFYVSFLFSFWPKIRELSDGSYWIFLAFIIPWFSDTASYFVGRSMGKHKLAPAISPNKTIEGAVGGILAGIFACVLYREIFFDGLTWLDCLLLGCVGSAFAQAGDLFESFIKRAFRVKDSGFVIPGHGGILDRFDGVLFCAPFLYFYVSFFK